VAAAIYPTSGTPVHQKTATPARIPTPIIVEESGGQRPMCEKSMSDILQKAGDRIANTVGPDGRASARTTRSSDCGDDFSIGQRRYIKLGVDDTKHTRRAIKGVGRKRLTYWRTRSQAGEAGAA
jgi:hypothetical protein